jgi:nitrogen fixation/metabolism regulation signal transduction histidine kinase
VSNALVILDPEILPRLFSKFVTKSQKGTGIGLYILNIVEAHGGRLYANNKQTNLNDKGGTFPLLYHYLENKNKELIL